MTETKAFAASPDDDGVRYLPLPWFPNDTTSANGTSRHFNCDAELDHYWGEADIEQRCTRSTPRNDETLSPLKFPEWHLVIF